MKYMGSKARHVKEILPIILKNRKPDQVYVEPFAGGMNVIHLVGGPRIAADVHEYLIALFSAVANGWIPPENVSEETYKQIKRNPESFPKHLAGFVGFGCSYSGKWWGGFARGNTNNGEPRNYAAESSRNIVRQSRGLVGVKFLNASYLQLEIPPQSLIYCDPPYAGTTKYRDAFGHADFWKWCDAQYQSGHMIFVSEYNAPNHWRCVWEKKVNNTLVKNTGSKQGIERLFVPETATYAQ